MTETKPENPPAFARSASVDTFGDHPTHEDAQQGMTLRDYFAAAALPIAHALVVRDNNHYAEHPFQLNQAKPGEVAQEAYRIADAMLRARAA